MAESANHQIVAGSSNPGAGIGEYIEIRYIVIAGGNYDRLAAGFCAIIHEEARQQEHVKSTPALLPWK